MCIKIIWRKSVSCRIIKNNESQSSFILVKNKRKSSVSCIFLVFLKASALLHSLVRAAISDGPGHLDPFSRSSGATPPSQPFFHRILSHSFNKQTSVLCLLSRMNPSDLFPNTNGSRGASDRWDACVTQHTTTKQTPYTEVSLNLTLLTLGTYICAESNTIAAAESQPAQEKLCYRHAKKKKSRQTDAENRKRC